MVLFCLIINSRYLKCLHCFTLSGCYDFPCPLEISPLEIPSIRDKEPHPLSSNDHWGFRSPPLPPCSSFSTNDHWGFRSPPPPPCSSFSPTFAPAARLVIWQLWSWLLSLGQLTYLPKCTLLPWLRPLYTIRHPPPPTSWKQSTVAFSQSFLALGCLVNGCWFHHRTTPIPSMNDGDTIKEWRHSLPKTKVKKIQKIQRQGLRTGNIIMFKVSLYFILLWVGWGLWGWRKFIKC